MKTFLKLILSTLALAAASAFAQGTLHFEWLPTNVACVPKSATGDPVLFLASFDALLSPATSCHEGMSNFVLIGPDGAATDWPYGLANFSALAVSPGGHPDPWDVGDVPATTPGVTYTFPNAEYIRAIAPGPTPETNITLYEERGFWISSPVPEPSSAALLVLGLVLVHRAKAASRT
jgi:hypothetical protein